MESPSGESKEKKPERPSDAESFKSCYLGGQSKSGAYSEGAEPRPHSLTLNAANTRPKEVTSLKCIEHIIQSVT